MRCRQRNYATRQGGAGETTRRAFHAALERAGDAPGAAPRTVPAAPPGAGTLPPVEGDAHVR